VYRVRGLGQPQVLAGILACPTIPLVLEKSSTRPSLSYLEFRVKPEQAHMIGTTSIGWEQRCARLELTHYESFTRSPLAIESGDGGMVRPNAPAVLRLMISLD
jgi:hypothetical protein